MLKYLWRYLKIVFLNRKSLTFGHKKILKTEQKRVSKFLVIEKKHKAFIRFWHKRKFRIIMNSLFFFILRKKSKKEKR